MTERRRDYQTESGDQLAYAPRFGIELMNECDHAQVVAGLLPPAAETTHPQTSDLCLRCPRCSRMVDVRFWRPESGDWYLRLRDRFAAAHMSLLRYSGTTWVTDG